MRWLQESTSSIRPSFFQALRIVTWGALQLQKRRTELGPHFHCPTCLRPEKNLPKGCPKCELTEAVNFTRADIVKEAALRWGRPGGTWPFTRWPLERVFEIHNYVANLLAENDDAASPEWFEDVVALSRVIQSEQAQDTAVQHRMRKK